MIKAECFSDKTKLTMSGSPSHLMRQSGFIVHAITKRIFAECPEYILDDIQRVFTEEIITSIKEGFDDIKRSNE